MALASDNVRRATRLACAKINLVLDLLGPRDDGYTEIATIFQTVALADRVDVELLPAEGDVELAVDGPEPCPARENLAWRAAARYRSSAGIGNAVRVSLTKRIPAGAGLGGGSSDAAAVLRGLDALARPQLGAANLTEIARELGADVPYFLHGGLALGRGRGDDVEPLDELKKLWVVLARAGGPLSTATVYAAARRGLTHRTVPPNILRFRRCLEESGDGMPPLANDLQAHAVALRPEIGRLLEHIEAAGGRALLSGSGSAVFGLFEREATARTAAARIESNVSGAWVDVSYTVTRNEIASSEASCRS